MTLDEIISNAEFCANEYKKYSEIAHEPERSGFKQYEEEHRQLAEWLKDYKRLKEQKCEVLDKIRAEIEKVAERHNQRPEINYDTAYSDGLYGAITIINRIVESEG